MDRVYWRYIDNYSVKIDACVGTREQFIYTCMQRMAVMYMYYLPAVQEHSSEKSICVTKKAAVTSCTTGLSALLWSSSNRSVMVFQNKETKSRPGYPILYITLNHMDGVLINVKTNWKWLFQWFIGVWVVRSYLVCNAYVLLQLP